MLAMHLVPLALIGLVPVRAMDNGLARTPPVGWSSWCAALACLSAASTAAAVAALQHAGCTAAAAACCCCCCCGLLHVEPSQFSIDLIIEICSPQIHVATVHCANQAQRRTVDALSVVLARFPRPRVGRCWGLRGHKTRECRT